MPRITRRTTHPLAGSNRTTQRNIGARTDTFPSIVFLRKSSPKGNYPRNLSSAHIRVCNNRRIRPASTEVQCSRTESVAEEEDTPRNNQNLCLRTETGSLNGRVYRQVEETMCACQTLSPLSPHFCYSMRRYLMEQDELLLFERNQYITNETEARLDISIDSEIRPYRTHILSCERDTLDRDESSEENQL